MFVVHLESVDPAAVGRFCKAIATVTSCKHNVVTLFSSPIDLGLPVQEQPEPNSMPAAVSSMIEGLLRAGVSALHDEKIFDQAYFAQLMTLFKVRPSSSFACLLCTSDRT